MIRYAIILALIATPAFADEQMTPLAVSGDWIAMAHSDSMTDPPDVCLAFNSDAGFAIRADDNDVEIRYQNASWSLPDNVTGVIDLKIQTDDFPLQISDNTNNQVTAVITDDQLSKIVADMNKAASMTVAAGSGPPTAVSLDGSNVAITAFLTCAGKDQPGSTGGSNPFAGQND